VKSEKIFAVYFELLDTQQLAGIVIKLT